MHQPAKEIESPTAPIRSSGGGSGEMATMARSHQESAISFVWIRRVEDDRSACRKPRKRLPARSALAQPRTGEPVRASRRRWAESRSHRYVRGTVCSRDDGSLHEEHVPGEFAALHKVQHAPTAA